MADDDITPLASLSLTHVYYVRPPPRSSSLPSPKQLKQGGISH